MTQAGYPDKLIVIGFPARQDAGPVAAALRRAFADAEVRVARPRDYFATARGPARRRPFAPVIGWSLGFLSRRLLRWSLKLGAYDADGVLARLDAASRYWQGSELPAPVDRAARLRRWLDESTGPDSRDAVFVACDPPTQMVDDLCLAGLDPQRRQAVLIVESGGPGIERRDALKRLSRLCGAAPPVIRLSADQAISPVDMRAATLAARDAASAEPPRPVLVLADRYLLDDAAGNVAVFHRQLAFLGARGETVMLAVFDREGKESPLNLGGVLADYPIVASETLDTRVMGRRDPYGALAPLGLGPLGRHTDYYRHLAFSPPLHRLAVGDRFAFVIANYFWTAQVLGRLGVAAPVICESHDLQTHQYASQGGGGVNTADLALELEILRQADAVIAINDTEAKFLRAELAPGRVHYNVGGFDSPAVYAGGDLAALGDAIEAANPQRAVTGFPADATLDILFIGHSNLHNLRAVEWLLDDVLPRLGPGYQTVIAGAVARMPGIERYFDRDGVHFLGVVENLAPLYAAATVVAVPLLSGEGTSIKTIEAMAHGKALAATSKGLRGMGEVDYPRADDPQGYAGLVSRILNDAAFREDLGERSRRIARSFGTEAYFERFDRIVEAAKGVNASRRAGE